MLGVKSLLKIFLKQFKTFDKLINTKCLVGKDSNHNENKIYFLSK